MGGQDKITCNDDQQFTGELVKIRSKLKLAYQIIQNDQKAKIALVVKLKEVSKELEQLKSREVEARGGGEERLRKD